MGPFKAVIFDLDDTLFDCTGSLAEASGRRAARALVEAGLPLSEEQTYALQRELSEQYGPHFLVFDEIGTRYDLSADVVDAAYHAYNSDEVEDIQPFVDVIPTLRLLRRQKILCFLLTSGLYRRQSIKIEKLGLREEFDEIAINDIERGLPLGESLRHLLAKYNLRPAQVLVVGDRPQSEIRAGNELGTATARMIHGKFSVAEPRTNLEEAHYRITHIFQVPTLVRLANMNRDPANLRAVAIGGGTGLPVVLEGLKTYSLNLTGNELFQYRFRDGSLSGMSLGNLIIAAMTDIAGSFDQGIRLISELLNIRGRVLPSTLDDCQLCAEREDGALSEGEVSVREVGKAPIKRVFLEPPDPEALDEAVDAIEAADLVVLGPGSLFTSVLSNLLVPGIRRAVANTSAHKFYLCNAMTQPGQTDGFAGSDHVRALQQHLGPEGLDYVLVNTPVLDPEILARYRQEGAEVVSADPGLEALGVRVVEANLLEDVNKKRVLWEKQDFLRHHPDRTADALCRIYARMELHSG